MSNILLLDTSVASQNRGDEIIMECVRQELSFLLKDNFEYTLPTQVSPFHWYQVLRNSSRLRTYADCPLKFIGGTNILAKNMFTHYPQWNINWFNCSPLKGSIGVGIGAGAGEESNYYTRALYRKVLSHTYFHSVRDERTKIYVEEDLGLKAINTGCVTMWMLTPEFCANIPKDKAQKVVFTLTANGIEPDVDRFIVRTLAENYSELYFWPQGINDHSYLRNLDLGLSVKILEASKSAYGEFLRDNDVDYVGTRLHGGIYAMRHGRRSIIIAIDERAREINKVNNLNCIDINDISELSQYINQSQLTEVFLDMNGIAKWKKQFVQSRS